jgi:hypothetical protein
MQLLHLLIIVEVMSIHETKAQLVVGIHRKVSFYQVGDESDTGFWQSVEDEVILDVLFGDVVEDKLPLGHGEPGNRIVRPEW